MKKTHWFRNTLIVLIVCGLAGTALAAVLFSRENNRTYASSSVLFSFDVAAEGLAPNGYRFDISGLTTDEVLNAALDAAGLTGTYTAEQLRENLSVTGIYPEKIAEQMTKYVSLLDENAGSQAAVTDYHATQYSVKLYDDFDRNISSGTLSGLLKEILAAYRVNFAKTGAPKLTTANPITDLPEYDYAQQLEAIGESVTQESRYAEEMSEMAPDFLMEGKGFGDIAVRYQSLENDINRLNAAITLNAVSKDRERLQKRYEMEIRSQNIQLESLTEELKLLDDQVKSYDKDGIIYVSANGELNRVGSSASDTYDKLVEMRKKVTDKISETNAIISLYQALLDDMTGAAAKTKTETGAVTAGTAGDTDGADTQAGETGDSAADAAAIEELNAQEMAALQATVESQIQALVAKKGAVVDDFTAMLNAYTAREINESTVSVTPVKYKKPSLLSGEFAVRMIKTVGPFCAVGFMVCMVLLIISRRKEEK